MMNDEVEETLGLHSALRLKLESGMRVVAVRAGANNGHRYAVGTCGGVARDDEEAPTVTTDAGLDLAQVNLTNWERLRPCARCHCEQAEESQLRACETCNLQLCGGCHNAHQPCAPQPFGVVSTPAQIRAELAGFIPVARKRAYRPRRKAARI
jgi:hypothetical protein